jgi:antitoxin YefM
MGEMTTVPLAEVRANLSTFVDAAQQQGRRTTITRDGRPVAVLVAFADLEAATSADPDVPDQIADTNGCGGQPRSRSGGN